MVEFIKFCFRCFIKFTLGLLVIGFLSGLFNLYPSNKPRPVSDEINGYRGN